MALARAKWLTLQGENEMTIACEVPRSSYCAISLYMIRSTLTTGDLEHPQLVRRLIDLI